MKSKLLLLLLPLTFLGCGNKKPVLLRLHYSPGDEITYIFQQKTFGTSEFEINNETEMKLSVDSVNGDNITFAGKLVALKTHSKVMGQEEDYDSRKNGADMNYQQREMHQSFMKALSENYTLTMNNRGVVVQPFKNWSGAVVEAPIDINVAQLVFPEKPVSVGYTWTAKRKNPILNRENTFKYTIDKITDTEVIIAVEADLSLKPLTADAKSTGKYTIDLKTGKLLTGYMETKLPTVNGRALMSIFTQ